MPSIWNLKFRYVFVYKKNVILIITKHVLYKECFPDELNYLFCFNVYVRTAMALWYILSVLLERTPRDSWMIPFVKSWFLWFMIRWTKQTTASFVLSICVKHSAFIMFIFQNIFIEPILAFNVSFYLSVSPVVFLAAVMLAHFCSDRSSAVNMYIIISYVSSDLHHMSMVFLFFKGKRQDVTVLVPLVHFF